MFLVMAIECDSITVMVLARIAVAGRLTLAPA